MSGESRESLLFKRHRSYYPGDPVRIIAAACRTVGVTVAYLQSVLSAWEDVEVDLTEPTVPDWICACQFLHLDLDCISYGYFPDFHRLAVGRALERGDYTLPNTGKVRRLWKWYRGIRKRERASEARYYGKRLLFRVRRQQMKERLLLMFRRRRPCRVKNTSRVHLNIPGMRPGLVTSLGPKAETQERDA